MLRELKSIVNQRGNIIGMLREAANARGETFRERINSGVNLNAYKQYYQILHIKLQMMDKKIQALELRVPALKQLLLYQNCHV